MTTTIAPPVPCRDRYLLFDEVSENRPERGKRQQADYDAQVCDAKRLCWTCQDRLGCLQRALATPMPGVWGGTTEDEREGMNR